MEKQEFVTRTGFDPMDEEYEEIEQLYYSFDGDKDAFCKHFVAKGEVMNFLFKRADTIKLLEQKLEKAAKDSEHQIKAMEKEIEKLKKALDIELEWKPCSGGTNMRQEEYEKLLHTCDTEILDDYKAKHLLYEEFGFSPDKISIISSVSTYESNKHNYMRELEKYERKALYNATDWNYIRFDCACWMFEMVNGCLRFYNC